MAYQPSSVIEYQSHPTRRTAVVLFHPYLGWEWGKYGSCLSKRVYVQKWIWLREWSSNSQAIIIIIMSCRQHGYPWPSLATSPYRSSPLAGLQGYIPYPHRAAVCMFELVILLLLGHMWGSLVSSSLLLQQCPACLVRLTWIVFVMGGRWPYSWCFVGNTPQSHCAKCELEVLIYLFGKLSPLYHW